MTANDAIDIAIVWLEVGIERKDWNLVSQAIDVLRRHLSRVPISPEPND